ncbi:MAG: DUF4271 domain-containing protein [Bernardetiaceae bacterium]|nr:DUF4271 domain-containing protein [Bernardetiaceae bacterium]
MVSLQASWSTYDRETKVYEPFLWKIHTGRQQVYLRLDTANFAGRWLSLAGQPGAYLFANHQLVSKWETAHWKHFRLDSLRRLMARRDTVPLALGYYWPVGNVGPPPAAFFTAPPDTLPPLPPVMARDSAVRTLVVTTTKAQPPAPRPAHAARNYFTVLWLGLLAAVALISATGNSLFSPRYLSQAIKAVFSREREPPKRFEAGPYIIFTLYYSLALAFTLLLLDHYTTRLQLPDFLRPAPNLWGWLGSFGGLAVGILAALGAKYLWLNFLGGLYNDRQLPVLHLYDFMNISRLFISVVLLLALGLAASPPWFVDTQAIYLFYLVMGGWLLKTLLVCYRINKASNHRDIYLFAYLCTGEILPILAALKLFVTF